MAMHFRSYGIDPQAIAAAYRAPNRNGRRVRELSLGVATLVATGYVRVLNLAKLCEPTGATPNEPQSVRSNVALKMQASR